MTEHGQRGRRQVIAGALVGLAILFGIEPAFADQFYFTRTRALGGVDPANGETGLFRWNDATNAQSQVSGDGSPLRHATDGRMTVDAIATDLSGTLYGFAIDDTSTAGFLPWSTAFADQCTATQRSRLISINTTTAVVTYVGTSWLNGRQIAGAAFDGQGRLWAYDCVSASVLQISPATGGIIGAPVPVNLVGLAGYDFDLDFAANGTGIIGYGGLQFRAFDPDTGWVADVPTNSQNNGFDGTFEPPYMVPGVAFTNHLSARNGSPQAEACRLNIGEIRGTDELGHVNDPFFANPSIAHKDVNKYNPPNVTNHNAGPGDLARVGGPALPDCFYDWGDAPNSYGTLLAGNGARHTIIADSPYLGAGLPDFEIDGQPNAGATGDNSIGTDDEDGAVVPALPTGMTAQIQVAAGNVGPGTRLQGWIDWAGDGSFAQTGDQILVDAAVTTGTNTFDIAVPATATVGTTTARFRIANQVGLGFLGLAESGEVEDYQVEVATGETDLAIAKTDGSSTYSPGFDATYTIVVRNNGPGAVTGARVSDPLPAGISSASWTCGGATGGSVCGAASGTGAIDTTADLPVGASVTYTLSLGIPVSYSGDLTNIATVTPPAGITDTNLDNNDASDTNTMEPPPTSGACAPLRVIGNTTFSLAPFAISGTVQKSGAPNGWMPSSPWSTLGGNYTFTWTFSQPVPANWIRFAVSDVGHTAYQTTPARFSIALGAGSAATPADFSLVAGWHDTFTDMAYNASTGVMTFVPTGGVKQAGALQGNSTDMVTSITITGTNVNLGDYIVNLLYVRPSCLTLEKVSEGGTGPFTIDMTNVAEADGTVVPSTTLATTTPGTPVSAAMLFFSPVPGAVMALSEDVPPGWNNTAAVCTDQNAGSTGNPPVIGSFASPTITIPADNVRPEADIHCRFTNALAPEVDLSITKTDGAATYVPGFDVKYTIVVSNTGPGDVVGAQVSDPLPAGISDASWTCGNATNGGVCGAASGTGAIATTADLPAGASVTYTMSLGVPIAYTGNLTNTATVAAPGGVTETNLDNNEASDTNTMEPPPTSGACAPRLVIQGANFTLAPFPTTGTVQKSAASGWQVDNPWATRGGNYTFRWTFSQPVPASWIRFAVIDVNSPPGPTSFTITLGAGSTATMADFTLAEGGLLYNPATGVLRYNSTGPLRQSGHLQGNGGDTVTSITIVSSGVVSGDNIANSLFVRPACVTLQKTSENGTGSFQVDMNNVVLANGTMVPTTTLTTSAPDTPVSSPEYYSIIGQDMTLSEVVPSGWNLESAVCTDQNAGNTGNPPVIGSFASPTITIPAANVRPEADIRCLFTNQLLPAADLAVVKTVAPNQVFSGQQVVYTLQVTNNGPESADGALLTDPQPVGLDCSAGTLTCGSAAGGAICPASPTIVQLQGTGVPIPTLPMGGSVAFTLTCTVTASGEP